MIIDKILYFLKIYNSEKLKFKVPDNIYPNYMINNINSSFIIYLLRLIKLRFGLNFNFNYLIKFKDGTDLYANIYTRSFVLPYKKWVEQIELLENDIVLDFGSHIGLFSLILAQKNNAKYHLFEIDQQSINSIKKSIHKLNINNVCYHNRAVFRHNDGVVFSSSTSTTNSVCDSKFFLMRNKNKKKYVDSIEFEQILINEKISRVKLLKCDVEGSEYAIFNDPKKLLCIDYLIIELHATEEYPLPEQTYLYHFIENNFEILSKKYSSKIHGSKLVEMFCKKIENI